MILLKKLKKKYLGLVANITVDKLGKCIEPKIKPLVIALNYKRYGTTMSCQGHSLNEREESLQKIHGENAKIIFRAERGLVYKIKEGNGRIVERTFNETPWVDIKILENQRDKLLNVLTYHNQRTGIVWRLEQFKHPNDRYRLECIPRYDITIMQEDISELAKDVFEKG